MCGAPEQETLPAGIDPGKESIVAGTVERDGAPVGGAFVRLLDEQGEFTAEVVASATGQFRFFARPGTWTLRALAPGAVGEAQVQASEGAVASVRIQLS
ncbi:MAG: DUF1416 domain-containing protein [Mycobacteriales bacterium]